MMASGLDISRIAIEIALALWYNVHMDDKPKLRRIRKPMPEGMKKKVFISIRIHEKDRELIYRTIGDNREIRNFLIEYARKQANEHSTLK